MDITDNVLHLLLSKMCGMLTSIQLALKVAACSGFGILHYPDGKRFEGTWREGKKHGKGFYIWPTGAKYHCVYLDGNKKDQGQLDNSSVSHDELKQSYGSI